MSLPLPPPEQLSAFPGHNFALIHGLGMAPVFWRLYAPQFMLEHKTIAYPLPGHDGWPLPVAGQPLYTQQIVSAYANAIERDFRGQPVTLVGHSTGGFVSLAIAAARPDLVRAIVLIGGFACGRFEGRERLAARLLRIPHIGPALFQTLFKRWISTRETFRSGSIDCVYDKSCPWESDETQQMMEDVRVRLQCCRPEDVGSVVRWFQHSTLLDHLEKITTPVLNLVGANDEIVPAHHQLRLARSMPNAMTVLFGQTGHLLMVERQSELNRILSRFSAAPWIVMSPGKPARIAKPRITSAQAEGWVATRGSLIARFKTVWGTKTAQIH
ncbi:alpha/beta hydrolase [Ciceribacter sp. L1K23]|uniref:alpha/beta fold hydrolase n=1 Tax=Ciceribacter sp. L1K23 TaxID=2820276 RepID=UPI001B83C49E|nr:alpha/beta hydrolase [Ciceribacter sp. L1K23]MBR0554114.1 alpha/beta hydrolase [Ciceribacter sp. L1K23]